MGQDSSTPAAPESAEDDGKATQPTVQSTAEANVVAVDRVIAQRGSIPITSRYTSTRALESEYTIEKKVVGSGMSGPVQLATGKADGRKYAVKSFKKKGLPAKRRKEMKSEVEIYLSLDHPHVARLEMVFESEEEIDLVMEYMAGGELYDRLSKCKQYTEGLAADTTYQMLLAVAYLHAHQVAHRDLKLENFLYEKQETNHLKLIDFGFAKFWDRSTKMTQACGSVHYVAPEVLRKSYTDTADIWSLGVIVYMLLTGSPPFHGSDEDVLQKVKAGKIHWSSRFLRLSEQAQTFVKSLLVFESSSRLSAKEALEHPWIRNRDTHTETIIDKDILSSLRNFAHAASFKRAVLSMLAWSLSTEDRAELRQQFLALDTEKKGTITHCQMKQVLEDTFHVDCDEAETLFQSLDTNNDDRIDYSEFLAAALQGRVKVHEDVLRRTFHRFDQTESGVITAVDLRQILGDHFEGVDVTELFREADTRGDGSINYDDFLAYFHKPDTPVDPALPNEAISQQSEKHQHIEKLGRVIDALIPAVTEESGSEHGASPKTPKPLNRKGGRAKTLPVMRRKEDNSDQPSDAFMLKAGTPGLQP
mmetsp:Transcript_40073/g.115561  ORF Transcript_40073/g.115561 Transcript_40073/m.115561 type:complete len:589 (+) Transcript_40073:61-1827(+)